MRDDFSVEKILQFVQRDKESKAKNKCRDAVGNKRGDGENRVGNQVPYHRQQAAEEHDAQQRHFMGQSEDQLKHIPLWMVNMIKILVMRLMETNEKLRTIVEQYAPPPVDTGSVITVDEDNAPPAPNSDHPEEPKEGHSEVHKHYQSEDIVKSLFES
jgi:hypothetical protein